MYENSQKHKKSLNLVLLIEVIQSPFNGGVCPFNGGVCPFNGGIMSLEPRGRSF